MDAGWWEKHSGHYHDGNWESISLLAPNGERGNQVSFGGAFALTEALSRCSYIQEVVDTFPGGRNRVRFLRLRAGGEIFTHSDPMHQIDPALLRIHVPVITNAAVEFRINGLRIAMQAGEAWCVDVRFRHSVCNASASDRVHLVIDVVAGRELRAMLEAAESSGQARLTGYFLKHALPRRVIRRLGIGN